jgi:hypothetical protein
MICSTTLTRRNPPWASMAGYGGLTPDQIETPGPPDPPCDADNVAPLKHLLLQMSLRRR